MIYNNNGITITNNNSNNNNGDNMNIIIDFKNQDQIDIRNMKSYHRNQYELKNEKTLNILCQIISVKRPPCGLVSYIQGIQISIQNAS